MRFLRIVAATLVAASDEPILPVTAKQLGEVHVTIVVQRCQSTTACLQVGRHTRNRLDGEHPELLRNNKPPSLLAKSRKPLISR